MAWVRKIKYLNIAYVLHFHIRLKIQMQHFVVPNFGESDETDIMLSRTPELWLDTDNTLMSDQLLLDHDMQNKNMDMENSPPTNRMNRARK